MIVFVLKTLLNSYVDSTVIRIITINPLCTPINIIQDSLDSLTRTLNRQNRTYPFTYLGRPKGTTKPKVVDFLPLVQRIETRLKSTLIFISWKIGNGKDYFSVLLTY